MAVWSLTETMKCLPFSGGWAEQPAEITTIIALFKNELALWENEQLEKAKHNP